MATRHSSTVGGSSADRTLKCPAWLKTSLTLPDNVVEISSEYAEQGSHYHDVMAALMLVRQKDNKRDLYTTASSYVGRHFYDRALTREGLETAIEPALDHLATLEKEYGGGFKVVGVELEARFPGIPGAFGTADLLLQSKTHVIMPDWKFGSGVAVFAVYVEDDEHGERVEYTNPQLMFYLTGALAMAPQLFAGRKIVGAIIQPRTDDPLTHTEITREELSMFAQDLETAIVEAFGPKPHRERGEHCRWAPCKVVCPLWTNPMLDLTAMYQAMSGTMPAQTAFSSKMPVSMPKDAADKQPTDYGVLLSKAKVLIDQAMIFKATLDQQIHSFLESGGLVPGFKLKAKHKNRQWVDETVVVPALKKLGFAENEIWQRKLQTFTSVDRTATRRQVTIPAHLRVAPSSNETTVTSIDDPALAVEPAVAVEEFRQALKKLTG